MGDQRRYFPDWTPLVLENCPELEADHNSYLAGGYAEEFGYRAQPGCSRGVPVLDGESPDDCAERKAQARATHPGYPIRAHPFELEWSGRASPAAVNWIGRREAYGVDSHSGFVVVYERQRRTPAERGAAIARRMTSALISLRWVLSRRL
jgi:hypothetical protein